ncbi:MAG: hypothetical protein GX282_02860 [Campylobacteraceae bacterium]|nr:hypothetical protein [Campylobacteraceae bacterium]
MIRVLILLATIFLGLKAENPDLEFLKSIKPVSREEVAPKVESAPLGDGALTLEDLIYLTPTNEMELNVDMANLYQEVRVTNLLLSTLNVPKQIYKNQIFSLNFKADIQQNVTLDLNLTMDKTPSLKWLNEGKLNWSKDIKGVYTTKLWFEANETDAKLNEILVIANRNGEFFQKAKIKPKMPKIIEVEEKANYAHIVADELKVLNYKTSKFDDSSNIMTIELSSKNANLESFYVNSPDIIRQGVDSLKGSFANQRGFYFAVVENDKENFDFSYFNIQTKQFENFSLGINLELDDLSTQTNLNPQNDPFALYKKAAIYLGVVILLFLYIVSQNSSPLIFACALIALNIYIQDPYEKGVVAKDAKVKILPIKDSTVFYIPEQNEIVEVFTENNNYYKVLFANQKIGWVHEDFINLK